MLCVCVCVYARACVCTRARVCVCDTSDPCTLIPHRPAFSSTLATPSKHTDKKNKQEYDPCLATYGCILANFSTLQLADQ